MRAKAIAAFLAATAILGWLAVPADAVPRSGTYKVPAGHVLQLSTRGTHGYFISIAVLDGQAQLSAVAQSESRVSFVLYQQTKRRHAGDDLDADFGRAGKLEAHFVPGKVEEERAPKGCTGGATVAETGYFVGSIAFHGAHGFTSFDAHRLKGSATNFPALVCRRPSSQPADRSIGSDEEGVLRLIAGDSSGAKFFDTVTEPPEDGQPSTTTYTASSKRKEGAVDILDTVEVSAPAPLAIPDLTAALPATATIEPPAPFSGSATLKAPSRQTATLDGDLSVDLPATGEVPLTGPGIAAGLCRGYTCSGSLPQALRPKRGTPSLSVGEIEGPEPAS